MIPQVICEVMTGSRLYGIHNQDSDYDYQGMYVPTLRQRLGLDYNADKEYKIKGDNYEHTYRSLEKIFRLLVNGNPGQLELLFAPDEFITHHHPLLLLLRSVKEEFLSKRTLDALLGYGKAQYKKSKSRYESTGQYDAKSLTHAARLYFEGVNLITLGYPLVDFRANPYQLKTLTLLRQQDNEAIEEIVNLLEQPISRQVETQLPPTPDTKLLNHLYLDIQNILYGIE